MGIFSDHAPRYWAAGLQAIPLVPGFKRPAVEGWPTYGRVVVPEIVQQRWLADFPDGNIGLALGPASDICVLDIDSTRPEVINRIESILPPSPWHRVGAKGKMLAYRWTDFKTFRIKENAGGMLVEALNTGTQCVLPPSIHPDTKLPYVANTDLFDPVVLGQLMILPPDVEEMLRAALAEFGVKLRISGHSRITEYVPAGERDVTMVSRAGLFAADVVRGARTFLEAAEQLRAWNADFVEHVVGDPLDIDKGIAKIAEFVLRDVRGPNRRLLRTGWDHGLTPAEKAAWGLDTIGKDDQLWSYQDICAFVRVTIETHALHSQGRRDGITEALRMVRAARFQPMDEEAILKYIAALAGAGNTVGVLRKQIKAFDRTDAVTPPLFPENHAAIAQLILPILSQGTQLCGWEGRVWRWSGSHWRELTLDVIKDAVRHHYGDAPTSRTSAQYDGVTRTVVEEITREKHGDGLEANPWMRPLENRVGINFANGFLDDEMVLHPHNPEFGATTLMPYRYAPIEGAPPTQFLKFLESCWGEDEDYVEKSTALAEAIAVTMFGLAPTFQRALCLHGQGSTGKSQLLTIVERLLPDDVRCAVPPSSLNDRFMGAEMLGKLLNICNELDANKKIPDAMFKKMVVGDEMTVQRKYQAPFAFFPRCAHWFATNHIPRTDDTSDGFSRRWLFLTFNRVFRGAERVLNLGERIVQDEREGIVTWALGAFLALKERREFTLPKSHSELEGEMRNINQSVRWFLLDSGVVNTSKMGGVSTDAPVSEMALYNAYCAFMSEAGAARVVLLTTFREQMRGLGYTLGFRLVVSTLPSGIRDYSYAGITLARDGPARRRA